MADAPASGNAGRDPRVDAYIAGQAEFARPILTHLRALVHRACPDAGEAIKWSMPFFTIEGRNLCNMAGFRAHAAFGFWESAMAERTGAAKTGGTGESAMGQFGRITALSDLPDDAALERLIADAAARIRSGEAKAAKSSAPRPARAPLPVPPDLAAAIAAHPDAARHWAGFTPGKIRDYAEWIGEAKREETRDKRIAEAISWIAEGKDRNWKYRR
jgi:uncharacterized protein YdeI (YjbR/CyaY-like superfamily)